MSSWSPSTEGVETLIASDGLGTGALIVVVVVLLAVRLGYGVSQSRKRRERTRAEPAVAVTKPTETGALPVAARRVTPQVTPGERVDDPILAIEHLTVAYGPKIAVDDLDLEIARGEIFGLLGPNGAGKTSTLSAIEGLLTPREGSVLLDGIDVRRHPVEARARMGVQLQSTSFQTELNVRQIVRLYAGLYGVTMTDSQIADDLEQIGLGGEAAKPFKQLSGGQQQRLSLFVAVIHEPDLLLLDEPTAGLDPQSRRQLWGRIERIRADGGSILLTTHSMEEAQAVCDRVAIIDHGTILASDTPKNLIDKYREDPNVRAVAHGEVTLEDVFIGLTGSEVRE